jgi:hypothetical protein
MLLKEFFNIDRREAEIGKTLLKYFELKRDYHRQAAERIDNEEAKFRKLLESATAPVYGSELESHLARSGSKIAVPIRSCVCRLLQLDVLEEGLFRVAAPTLKIRRLASLMGTGDCTDEQVVNHICLSDHCVCVCVCLVFCLTCVSILSICINPL